MRSSTTNRFVFAYLLTEAGNALDRIICDMVRWEEEHLGETSEDGDDGDESRDEKRAVVTTGGTTDETTVNGGTPDEKTVNSGTPDGTTVSSTEGR